MDAEIGRFKRDIDLVRFAGSMGYALDKKKSAPSGAVLKSKSGGDRLLVSRTADGAWRYCSMDDPQDKGDIVTFLRLREFAHLGKGDGVREACKRLREFTGAERAQPEPEALLPRVAAVPLTAERLRRLFSKEAHQPASHPYLESRGLRAETLSSPRFAAAWYVHGPYRNVVFPHYTTGGPSGYEIKNKGFTSFSPGGKRGFWVSRVFDSDRAMVVTETAIDALSHAQLRPDPAARYFSSAGALSEGQLKLLDRAMSRLGEGKVISAHDSDRAGERMAGQLAQLTRSHPGLSFERQAPSLGKDWNDQLRLSRAKTVAPSGPSFHASPAVARPSRDSARQAGQELER